ncbi:hypothetical protein BDV10DRAFT_198773 [Aspergillus recurvatus]
MAPFVVLLLLCSVLSHASSPDSSRRQELGFPEPKRLSAGTSSSKFQTRELSTLLQRKASFDYIADNVEEESVFSTTLDVESQWPILALEELDTGLNSVSCRETEINLQFVSTAAERGFRSAIKETSEFVVVTSHDGCDSGGDRSAHRVTGVSFENHRVSLETVQIDWHEAFSVTRVSFSRRHHSEIQKREPTPVKRQDASLPIQSFLPGPSEVDRLNSSGTKSFDVHHTGLKIYPVDIPLADEVIPQLPVVVKCRMCMLQGDIQLSQGQFTVGETEENDSDFELDEAIGFFTNSSIELLVKELFTQIELELEISSEAPLLELSTALPTIGLTPFQIAGVITFGPLIVPEIIITADLEGDVAFSYGFNVTVPDNSRVLISIPNFNESEITGFGDTAFETIPFEATTEVSSMALSIAFQPQILLGINTGIDTLNVNIYGGIGAFVSLPNLSLNVSKATGVDNNCEAVAETDDAIGNATHLVPSVKLDMGVIASYDVRLGPFDDSQRVAPILASTAWELPTACMGFEPEIKATRKAGLAAASDAGDDGGSNDGGGGGGGNSAVSLAGSGITVLCALILSTVAAGFCGWG